MVHRHTRDIFRMALTLGRANCLQEPNNFILRYFCFGGRHGLQKDNIFSPWMKVQSLEKQLLLRETTNSLQYLELLNGLTHGALQEKLKDAAEVCKGLEDVVGSVRGFLQANKQMWLFVLSSKSVCTLVGQCLVCGNGLEQSLEAFCMCVATYHTIFPMSAFFKVGL